LHTLIASLKFGLPYKRRRVALVGSQEQIVGVCIAAANIGSWVDASSVVTFEVVVVVVSVSTEKAAELHLITFWLNSLPFI
jgi:hypothetical protein